MTCEPSQQTLFETDAEESTRFVADHLASPRQSRAKADEFTLTTQGRERSAQAARDSWEQACRQRWRALALVIKAKLEAVECNISTIDDEFLAFLVLPTGDTVGNWMRPQILEAYSSGKMPRLLPSGPRE